MVEYLISAGVYSRSPKSYRRVCGLQALEEGDSQMKDEREIPVVVNPFESELQTIRKMVALMSYGIPQLWGGGYAIPDVTKVSLVATLASEIKDEQFRKTVLLAVSGYMKSASEKSVSNTGIESKVA
jgi:hypothetical protein